MTFDGEVCLFVFNLGIKERKERGSGVFLNKSHSTDLNGSLQGGRLLLWRRTTGLKNKPKKTAGELKEVSKIL